MRDTRALFSLGVNHRKNLKAITGPPSRWALKCDMTPQNGERTEIWLLAYPPQTKSPTHLLIPAPNRQAPRCPLHWLMPMPNPLPTMLKES